MTDQPAPVSLIVLGPNGRQETVAVAPQGYEGYLFDSPTLFVSPTLLLESTYPFEVEIPKGEDKEMGDVIVRIPSMGRVWKLTGKPHSTPGPQFFFEAKWPD